MTSRSIFQLPPEIDFSSFDFPNFTNSFLSDAATLQSIGEKYFALFSAQRNLHRRFRTSRKGCAAARLPNTPEWLVGVANVPTKIIFKKRLTWAFQNIRPSLSMTRN